LADKFFFTLNIHFYSPKNMRYAYYTIIQIKIPFQDDVIFEDQKKKRPGDRPFSK